MSVPASDMGADPRHADLDAADKCFICLDDESETSEPLVADVCGCKQMRVHQSCLEASMNASSRMVLPMYRRLTCPVCLEPYRITYYEHSPDEDKEKDDRRACFVSKKFFRRCSAAFAVLVICGGPAALIAVMGSAGRQGTSHPLIVGVLIVSLGFLTACWAVCMQRFAPEACEPSTDAVTIEVHSMGADAEAAAAPAADARTASGAPSPSLPIAVDVATTNDDCALSSVSELTSVTLEDTTVSDRDSAAVAV